MNQHRGPIGSLDPNEPITIIGAGISGLLMGYHLKSQGFKVSILECSSRVGGKIETKTTQFGIQEKAANAIYTDSSIIEVLQNLELDFIKSNSSLAKKVLINGRVTSKLLTASDIIKVLFNLLKTPPTNPEQSVFDFFVPLLGKKLTAQVLSAAFVGIYAIDSKELHFNSIFKDHPTHKTYLSFIILMIKNKRNRKGTSISFKNGMQEFVDGLKMYLKPNIKLSSEVAQIETTNTIICTNAHEAALILKNKNSKASELLGQIEYSSLSTTTIFTKNTIKSLNSSFGVLLSPNEDNFKIHGILNNTAIFHNRTSNKELNSYTFISKPLSDSLSEINFDLAKFERTLKKDDILDLTATHWQKALPIYNKNRAKIIQTLRSLLEDEKEILIFGNYIDGISIREINFMAQEFSKKLKLKT